MEVAYQKSVTESYLFPTKVFLDRLGLSCPVSHPVVTVIFIDENCLEVKLQYVEKQTNS